MGDLNYRLTMPDAEVALYSYPGLANPPCVTQMGNEQDPFTAINLRPSTPTIFPVEPETMSGPACGGGKEGSALIPQAPKPRPNRPYKRVQRM